jgi:hypothetical protein
MAAIAAPATMTAAADLYWLQLASIRRGYYYAYMCKQTTTTTSLEEGRGEERWRTPHMDGIFRTFIYHGCDNRPWAGLLE